MSEMLSPEAVDALLATLDDKKTNNTNEKNRNVQTYDFKRALRFSQDHIRILTRIHENYARLMTSYSSAQLRTIIQATVHSVEQTTFEEYVASITENSILSLFVAEPLQGQMVLEVAPNLAYSMLDRMLGGQGTHSDNLDHLTEIETMVMERIFTKILESFQDAWTSVVKLKTELKELEVNPHFLQIVSPNETVVTVTVEIVIGEVKGHIRLCLPHVLVEPIMPKLSAYHWLSNQKKQREPKESAAIKHRLKKTELEIIAELGQSEITIEEFLDLQSGDVIRLDKSIQDSLQIKVDNRVKFSGQAGNSKGRLAVQIGEIIDEEGGEYEG